MSSSRNRAEFPLPAPVRWERPPSAEESRPNKIWQRLGAMYSEHISDRPIRWAGVKEAARELHISRAKVRQLIRRLGIRFTYLEDGAPRPHTWDPHLDQGRHLMRAPGGPVRPVAHPLHARPVVASQPGMHRLPAHCLVARHLRHRAPAADDRHDRLVPLLSHAQLLHARECQASAETSGRHQPKLCRASAEHVLSCISRTRTQNLEPTARIRTGDPLFTNQDLSRSPGIDKC